MQGLLPATRSKPDICLKGFITSSNSTTGSVFKYKTTGQGDHSSVCLPRSRPVTWLPTSHLSSWPFRLTPGGEWASPASSSLLPPPMLAPAWYFSLPHFFHDSTSLHPQHHCHAAQNSCAHPSLSPGLFPPGTVIPPSSHKYVLSLCRVPGTGLGPGES